MIICVCRRVSDRDIARAVHEGCTSLDDLQVELGVATGCGKCRDSVCTLLEQHACATVAVSTVTGVAPLHPAHARPLREPALQP